MTDPKVVIKTTTVNDVSASTEIKNVKFTSYSEVIAEFPIPSKLNNIHI
jgi:hypothetical protein